MRFKKQLLLIGSLASAIVCLAAPATAAVDPVEKDGKGVAVKGYDVVAYFTQSKPVKGTQQFTHQWNGATWQFASAADRDLFAADPAKYAPQYGGYCAYGVSQNHAVPIDPEAWRIIEGKLYLNYSKSVQKTWLEDPPKRIEEANRNWPGLHK